MPNISFLGAQTIEAGAISASTLATAVAISASTNTKGAWTQLTAATARPSAWMLVVLTDPDTNGAYLVDIGIGGSGSETVLVANIPYSVINFFQPTGTTLLLPVSLPAGTRIAVRGQHATSSTANLRCQIHLFAPIAGGEAGMGRIETCGAVTASSRGTTIDPGAVANTKGAWVELIAATAMPYRWATVCITHVGGLAAVARWAVDIGVGGAGSEVVLLPDVFLSAGATADSNPASGLSIPLIVPVGTRLAARAQSNNTTATERNIEVIVHGCG